MKFAKAFLLLAFISLCAGKTLAAPVTPDVAAATVKAWLNLNPQPLGAHLGGQIRGVDTYKDQSGLPLYFVVNLNPSGFVIVSGDDQVEPIIAFVDKGHFDPSPKNTLGALIGKDISFRMAHVRAKKFTPSSVETKAHGKWQLFSVKQPTGTNGVKSAMLNDSAITVMVSPFIQSDWNQYTVDNTTGSPDCYNYFTPPYAAGDVRNYVCGCVATSMAQLMDYFTYPTVGVGTPSFEITVDSVPFTRSLRGGDGYGGPYDWANMPLNPLTGYTTSQLQAIGDVTADAGVAVHMAYTAGDSGSFLTAAQTALTSTFKFKNAMITEAGSLNVGYNLVGMINPNVDARLPVVLGIIDLSDNGHCVLVDGYGYNFTSMYHHLNLGWGGDDNAWYNLPFIDTTNNDTFYVIQDCIYNIYTNSTGEIISGRVTDSNTNPISGASITAVRVGGGIYTATADTNGIYALASLPSSSTYVITATNTGYFSSTASFHTGVSVINATNSGNFWGANFYLGIAHGAPVITNQPQNQAIIAGTNATFAVGATGALPLFFQWQVQPSGSASWVDLTDGSGYSGSTTPVLTVIDPGVTNNGEPFQCIVSNTFGTVTSSTATLTVSLPPYLTISTLAGTAGVIGYTDAMNGAIEFNDPLGIAVDVNTNIYIADLGNHVIRQLSLSGTNWVSTTIAGQVGVVGSTDGIGTNALFNGPRGIAVDNSGNIFVSDTASSTIRELTYSGGSWTVSTIAGLAGVTGSTNGMNSANRYRFPMGLVVDGSDNVFIADEGNSQIRKLSPSGGNWYGVTLAGLGSTVGSADGTSANATFSSPHGITVDASGNLYVADTDNNLIREVSPSGGSWIVTTIAGSGNTTGSADGTGSAALFNNPTGIAIDKSGDLYVVDSGNDTIRRLTVNGTNWTSFTSAGLALNPGSADGIGTAVRLDQPDSIAIDAYTNVYISDSLNGTIRGTPIFGTVTPAVLQMTKQKGGSSAFMLSWTASVGDIYQVQYTTNMYSGAWITLTNITASKWTGLTSVPIGPEPQRFYRVIQLH